MQFGYGLQDGQLVAQFVPTKPGEIDFLNELWQQIRMGADVKLKLEDFEPGIPQVRIILQPITDKEDEEEEE